MIYIYTTGQDPYKMQIRAEIITSWQLLNNNVVICFKSGGTELKVKGKVKTTPAYEWTYQKPIAEITNWPAVHTFLIGLNLKALAKLPAKLPTQESLF